MKSKNSKNSFFSLILGLAFALNFAACSQDSSPQEEGCNFIQNSKKHRVSWKSNLPLRFNISKDVPREVLDSIFEAALSWNKITNRKIIVFGDLAVEGSPESGYGDGQPTIYWKQEWETHKSSEQARSIVSWKGSTLRDADIWINAKNFAFSYSGETLSFDKVDLVSLIVHEIGHTLGLDHNHSTKSVMFASLRKGYDRRQVKHIGDFESFACEYGEGQVRSNILRAVREEKKGDSNLASDEERGKKEGGLQKASSKDPQTSEKAHGPWPKVKRGPSSLG